MAKRFTDTEKWKKVWFRELKPEHKCFWSYILDTCSHAGIWEVDFVSAQFFIGAELNDEEIKSIFQKQYFEIDNGKRWVIVDFINYQYGELSRFSKPHNSVIKEIEKRNGELKGILQEKGYLTLKDKDKDTDKDKDKDTDISIKKWHDVDSKDSPRMLCKQEGLEALKLAFLSFYNAYPNRVNKAKAYLAFKKLNPSNELLGRILNHIQKQIESGNWNDKKFIPHPTTYLNGERWNDEIYNGGSHENSRGHKPERIYENFG